MSRPFKAGSLKELGLINTSEVHYNLPVAKLVERALARGEGVLTSNGALRVETGKYTGRSPNDKFIVDNGELSEDIWWGKVNRPISEESFHRIFNRLTAYLQNRELFVFDGFVVADPDYRYPIRFINELAWQNIFAQQLFIKMEPEQQTEFKPYLTLIAAPTFHADPELDNTIPKLLSL